MLPKVDCDVSMINKDFGNLRLQITLQFKKDLKQFETSCENMMYRKPPELQNCSHFRPIYPLPLKKYIQRYTQAFCVSNICSETNEMTKHLAELRKAFLKRGYQETATDFQFNHLIDHEEHDQTKIKKEST